MMLYLVLALVAIVSAQRDNPLSQETIDYINNLKTTWKAGKNFGSAYTIDDIKAMCGALKSPKPILKGKFDQH